MKPPPTLPAPPPNSQKELATTPLHSTPLNTEGFDRPPFLDFNLNVARLHARRLRGKRMGSWAFCPFVPLAVTGGHVVCRCVTGG